MNLRELAHSAGELAAENYIRRGDYRRPPFSGRPVSLTQMLKGDMRTVPTDEEMRCVELGWREGWDGRWAAEYQRRAN